MENNALTHHGIFGMKWGVRRYQNKDGSLTKAGKKRYNDSNDNEDTAESYEEQKQKALKSGSASDILKFKGDLTQKEMQDAITRVRWEQDMKTLSEKEVAVGKSRADKAFEKVGKITDYTVTASKAYNTFANIYNAFNGTGKLLPTIQTNNTNDNRSARKAEAKERKKEEEARKKREEQEAQRETKQAERAAKKADKANKESSRPTHDSDYVIYDDPATSKKTSKSNKKSNDTVVIDMNDAPISNVPATITTTGMKVVDDYFKR